MWMAAISASGISLIMTERITVETHLPNYVDLEYLSFDSKDWTTFFAWQ